MDRHNGQLGSQGREGLAFRTQQRERSETKQHDDRCGSHVERIARPNVSVERPHMSIVNPATATSVSHRHGSNNAAPASISAVMMRRWNVCV